MKKKKVEVHSKKPTAAKHDRKKKTPTATEPKSSDGGLDEIESLFATKKQRKQQEKEQQKKNATIRKNNKKRNPSPQARPTTSINNNNGNNNDDDEWIDDGLGGKYNSEGYTGRIEDGMKIFKTHLLQSNKSGTTPECPFDCSCCFI